MVHIEMPPPLLANIMRRTMVAKGKRLEFGIRNSKNDRELPRPEL
jgi:hypothetical protein